MNANNNTYSRVERKLNIGLVINPLAGVGGRVAKKGSDGEDVVASVHSGALGLTVPQRLSRFFTRLTLLLRRTKNNENDQAGAKSLKFFNGGGLMSALKLLESEDRSLHSKLLADAYLEFCSVTLCDEHTTRADTINLVKNFNNYSVDLLLFVGGDGTARDIASSLLQTKNTDLTVLGIPAGVKMHSGVFATSPESAAELVYRYMQGELLEIQEREVRDLDEARYRRGDLHVAYYASLPTLTHLGFSQAEKVSEIYSPDLELDDIAAEIEHRMLEQSEQELKTLFLFGAGTTTRHILQSIGLEGTLLGIDAVVPEAGTYGRKLTFKLLAHDVDASWLEKHVSSFAAIRLILSPTGGQGFVFGRGNQQLSGKFLSRLDPSDLWIVSLKEKLLRLEGRPLLIDLDNIAEQARWSSSKLITTGYQSSTLYPIAQA